MVHQSIWFRVGYALERARQESAPSRLRALARRAGASGSRRNDGPSRGAGPVLRRRPGAERRNGEGDSALDALLTTGAGTLAGRILGLWRPQGRPGLVSLARAGAAGAGAALLHELVAPLLHEDLPAPRLDHDLADALLAGAARGLVYASVAEPRLPGPPLVRGALFASVEYLASPWGGLTAVLGREAPHRRLPFLRALFEGYEPGEDRFLDHLAFAVALALLYRGRAGELPPAGDE